MRRYNHENLDNIKNNVEIYRLATLIGLYSKEEMIKYLDEIILDLEEVPNEIIEASVCKNKKIDDISMSLREYTNNGKCNKDYVLDILIKIIAKQYYDKKITLCEAIYYLDNLRKIENLKEDVEDTIVYLSDGYYLANEGIYGNLDTIKGEFEKFILQYK